MLADDEIRWVGGEEGFEGWPERRRRQTVRPVTGAVVRSSSSPAVSCRFAVVMLYAQAVRDRASRRARKLDEPMTKYFSSSAVISVCI